MKIKTYPFFFAGLISTGVFAQDGMGAYVAFDIGQFTFKGYCDTDATELTSAGIVVSNFTCDDSATSWRGSVGIPVNSFITSEIGYYYSGPVSGTLAASYLTVPFTASVKTSERAFQFSLVGSYGFADRLALFAKAGVTRWDVQTDGSFSILGLNVSLEDSAKGFDPVWGVGFKYDVNEKVALRGMFESHKAGEEATTGRGSVDFMGVGLLFAL